MPGLACHISHFKFFVFKGVYKKEKKGVGGSSGLMEQSLTGEELLVGPQTEADMTT